MKLHLKKLGHGDPLLILHGLFGASDNWLTIGRELAKHNQVFLIDARNHGRSPHSDHIDYPAMVEDVYEFLTDFQLRRISLIGHSMGGKTAMNFALEYPHRLEKLIVVDIAPREYPVLHREILDGLLAINLSVLKNRSQADHKLSAYIAQKNIRQFLLKNLYRNESGRYMWRLNLDVLNRNIYNLGSGIFSKNKEFGNPALFIRGKNSNYITYEDEKMIRSIFPASKIITIPDASHWVHHEKPQALLDQIRLFLSS